MKSLGKIFLLLLFLTSYIYAGVSANVSPAIAAPGDVVTYSVKIDGSADSEPAVYQLCGQNIISSGSSTNIEMIGSNYKKTKTYFYQFTAQKSCTIDPIEVEIDGKKVRSNSVDLVVKKSTSNVGKDFILEYEISKTDLYVGESTKLTLTLKQHKNASAVDSKFFPSDFQGFWKKGEAQPVKSDEAEYMVTKVEYILAPQREGNVTIKPAELRVASRVASRGWELSFMPQIQWKSYFSNEINLNVKPIPGNASLIGDFTIDAKADKRSINPNEAVNVVVSVKGEGNLEDIESFKAHINGVNIFDEKIEVKGNTLTQKLVFVGDGNFTIPPFELTFFDTNTKKLKKIHTDSIDIDVKGAAVSAKPQNDLTIKKAPTDQTITEDVYNETLDQKQDPLYIGVVFVLGVLVGIVIMLLKGKFPKSDQKNKFSLKDEKLLLIKLLPFKEKDFEVKTIIEILEKNIYSDQKESIDKAKLKEIMKRYNII